MQFSLILGHLTMNFVLDTFESYLCLFEILVISLLFCQKNLLEMQPVKEIRQNQKDFIYLQGKLQSTESIFVIQFFNYVSYLIGGEVFTLQDIENGVLRGNRKGVAQLLRPFSKTDPRLQVGLHPPAVKVSCQPPPVAFNVMYRHCPLGGSPRRRAAHSLRPELRRQGLPSHQDLHPEGEQTVSRPKQSL